MTNHLYVSAFCLMKVEAGGSSEVSLPICHATTVNYVTSQVTVIPEFKKFFILLTGPFSPVGTTWCVSSMTGRMYGTLPPIWSTWSHIISSSTLVTLMLLLVLPSVRMMTRKGLTLPKYQVTSSLLPGGVSRCPPHWNFVGPVWWARKWLELHEICGFHINECYLFTNICKVLVLMRSVRH